MGFVPLWTCPLCRKGLNYHAGERCWSCENNHLFDCAREGYVNLLPANRKRSSEPGDSAQMISARRRIHTAEIFRPLANNIQSILAGASPATRILDLGCGEGFYSSALYQAQRQAQVCAIDISKPAIKLAAKHYPAVHFAVASTFQLPVLSESQDIIVRIFAPSDDREMARVLVTGGTYLEVTPAPAHLWTLREALYETPRAHVVARTAVQGMQLLQTSILEFEVELAQPLLYDMVAMTPFAHKGHRERRESLLERDSLRLQMAFSLNLFQK